MKLHLIFILIVLGLFATPVQAQQTDVLKSFMVADDRDTVFTDNLPDIFIYRPPKFANKRDYKNYWRTVYNLKIVYPYVVIAKVKLAELDEQYKKLPKKERKAYAHRVEKELFSEFEAPLKDLTISQGKMLIKLINRETGSTSYDIVKELKGSFNVFVWQSLARLFGSSLKLVYDKEGEDKILEQLVIMCENGTFDQVYRSMY